VRRDFSWRKANGRNRTDDDDAILHVIYLVALWASRGRSQKF